jgi:hypothetical protein
MEFAFQGNGVSWRRPILSVLRAEITNCDVNLFVEIADRDTGEIRTQLFTSELPAEYCNTTQPTPEQMCDILRKAYLLVVCHELAELLRIDGKWVDPHAPTFELQTNWKVTF